MAIEIWLNDISLELPPEEEMKYTFQVSDFFNPTDVKASYLDALTLPKTDNNTAAFQGLGLVSDGSRIPYEKTSIKMSYQGVEFIRDAWLDVKETAEDYKISIIDGIIDFFKDIEGKTIGKDLDLAVLSHEKTVGKVVDSFTNNSYRYIVTDYGGKKYTASGNINIDYLTPSISAVYILQAIAQRFGYTFSGSILNDPDLAELYLTYPKPPKEAGTETAVLKAEMERGFFLDNTYRISHQVGGVPQTPLPPGNYYFDQYQQWNTSTITEGLLLNNWKYVIPVTGNYRFDLKMKGRIQGLIALTWFYDGLTVQVIVNGTVVDTIVSDPEGGESLIPYYRTLNEADVVFFRFHARTTRPYFYFNFRCDTFQVKVNKVDIGSVDFAAALESFSIKEYIKEIFIRYGISPILNKDTRDIHLQTFIEKVNKSNIVNWTDKYVRRLSETYVSGSYAQKNYFKHKYNDEGQSHNDGVLYVNNRNLDEEKAIVTSKVYSPRNDLVSMNFEGIELPTVVFPIWQPEVKETGGVVSTEYKALSSRFYFIRSKVEERDITFESEILGGATTVGQFHFISTENVHFNSLTTKYYSKHENVLNDCRVHRIELALGLTDITGLDFSKIYHFEQEGQTYLVNKISWTPGDFCVGECIRVKTI